MQRGGLLRMGICGEETLLSHKIAKEIQCNSENKRLG
jgi:hypothetical protein